MSGHLEWCSIEFYLVFFHLRAKMEEACKNRLLNKSSFSQISMSTSDELVILLGIY